MPGLSMFNRITILCGLLLLSGCGGAKEEEPVEEHAIVGSWNYIPTDERDERRMEIKFFRDGRYHQMEEREMLSGEWRLEENDLVIDQQWRKMPSGAELDLEDAQVSVRYHAKMRGDELLMDAIENEGHVMHFVKKTK